MLQMQSIVFEKEWSMAAPDLHVRPDSFVRLSSKKLPQKDEA